MGKDIKQKIIDAIRNFATLKITTEVVNIRAGEKCGKPDDPDAESFSPDHFNETKKMVTKIDLLQGDIKTSYDEEFVIGKYQTLKAIHTEKEKTAYDIVLQNMTTLEKLLELSACHMED